MYVNPRIFVQIFLTDIDNNIPIPDTENTISLQYRVNIEQGIYQTPDTVNTISLLHRVNIEQSIFKIPDTVHTISLQHRVNIEQVPSRFQTQ